MGKEGPENLEEYLVEHTRKYKGDGKEHTFKIHAGGKYFFDNADILKAYIDADVKAKLVDQLQDILQWIFENHNHHEGTPGWGIDLDSGVSGEIEDTTICHDGQYPYVNSLELEEYLKTILSKLK